MRLIGYMQRLRYHRLGGQLEDARRMTRITALYIGSIRRIHDLRGGTRTLLRTTPLILFLAAAAVGCSGNDEPEALSTDRLLSNDEVLSRSLGEAGDADSEGFITSSVDGVQQSIDGARQVNDAEPTSASDSSENEDNASARDRVDVVVTEDGTDLTEPESITLDEAIEELGIETPCDLYTTPGLRTQMTEWAQTSGLTADLPNGLLTPGSEIAFDAGVQSPTNCSWFSEAQLWSVEISFQPASGFTDELQSRGEPVPGIGDSASIDDDTSGSLQVGDLFVTVTNLPPGHTQTSNDRAVLLLMLSDIAAKLT